MYRMLTVCGCLSSLKAKRCTLTTLVGWLSPALKVCVLLCPGFPVAIERIFIGFMRFSWLDRLEVDAVVLEFRLAKPRHTWLAERVAEIGVETEARIAIPNAYDDDDYVTVRLPRCWAPCAGGGTSQSLRRLKAPLTRWRTRLRSCTTL
jgi:hypothetical protein